MKRVTYNKLVRDAIPDIIRERGSQCEIEILDTQQFVKALKDKVVEESTGVSNARNKDELVDELADLSIVMDELKTAFDIDESSFSSALAENRKRKGGFSKRLFLKWSSDDGYQSNEATHEHQY